MPGTSLSPLFTWKRIWLILILLAAIWLLVSARAALGPVAAAFILAYLLNPVVGILERKKIPRTLGVILVLSALVVLLVLLSVSVAPLVEQQILAFSRSVPGYIRVIESWAEKTLSRFEILPSGQMSDFITQNLAAIASVPLEAIRAGGNVLIRTTTGLLSLLVTIAFIALIPVMTFYILRDLNEIGKNFYLFIHRDYRDEVRKRLTRLDDVLGTFIKGQFIVGLILAVLYTVGFYFSDVPLWLVLGIVTGLASMVPYLGLIVGLPTAVALTAIQHQDFIHPLMILLVFAIVFSAEGAVIVPRVVGSKVGLHPVVIIISVLVGAEVLGFVGVLIAVPLAAMVKVGLEALYDYYIA